MKNHENQPGVVQGGYGGLQVVTGYSKEVVMVFCDRQTNTHTYFIIIYISPSQSSSYESELSEDAPLQYLFNHQNPLTSSHKCHQNIRQISDGLESFRLGESNFSLFLEDRLTE